MPAIWRCSQILWVVDGLKTLCGVLFIDWESEVLHNQKKQKRKRLLELEESSCFAELTEAFATKSVTESNVLLCASTKASYHVPAFSF